jgi:hypothetical protein
VKGENELYGLEAPTIDKIVTFFQKFLGKEYILMFASASGCVKTIFDFKLWGKCFL